MVALAAAAIGVVLPWTSDGPVRLNWIQGPSNGWLVLIVAAFALGWVRPMAQYSWVGVVGVLGAAIVIGWTTVENWLDSRGVVDATASYGLLLTVTASIVLACAAATRCLITLQAARERWCSGPGIRRSSAAATPAVAQSQPGTITSESPIRWTERVTAQRLPHADPARARIAVSMTAALPMLRAAKDHDELKRLAAAGAAAASLEEIVNVRFAGAPRARSADRAALRRKHGHSQIDFAVVGFGPDAADPHHEMSERTIQEGDMVVRRARSPAPREVTGAESSSALEVPPAPARLKPAQYRTRSLAQASKGRRSDPQSWCPTTPIPGNIVSS